MRSTGLKAKRSLAFSARAANCRGGLSIFFRHPSKRRWSGKRKDYMRHRRLSRTDPLNRAQPIPNGVLGGNSRKRCSPEALFCCAIVKHAALMTRETLTPRSLLDFALVRTALPPNDRTRNREKCQTEAEETGEPL
jgi:hypothetical protein